MTMSHSLAPTSSASNSSRPFSLGGLFRKYLKKCPFCEEPIDRCLMIEKLQDRFLLFCSVCEGTFTQPKSEESSMTTGCRKYSRKELVTSLDQIGVCDLMRYEVCAMGIRKENIALCSDIDRKSKSLRAVKLAWNDENVKVVESEVTEAALTQGKATVYRFMPLDCCSKDETLSRALQSVANGDQNWLTATVGPSLDFEKFANWMKTGEMDDLILRIFDVISKCPTCKQPLFRSFILSYEPIELYCTACRERYEVQDTKKQLSKLRGRYCFGEPCKTEKLSSIDQLGPADIFKRRIEGLVPVSHHFICMDVNRIRNTVLVVDMSQGNDGNVVIQKYLLKFEELKNSSPKVFRYLPLDCLPGEETLQRAEEFAEGYTTWEPEKYSVFSNNCQHFVSFCKIEEKRSEDVDSVREIALGSAGAMLLVLRKG